MKVGYCCVSKDDQDLSSQKDALKAAAARGRKGSRPPSMTAEKIRAAAEMLKNGDNVSQVAPRTQCEPDIDLSQCPHG